MTHVIAEETLKARLKDISESLEIRDEAGNVVGYCWPVSDHAREADQDHA